MVAAGGGGDAITATALTRIIPAAGPPVIMTYSWDRLMIDPLPGPRVAVQFTGLDHLAPHVWQVLPSTSLAPPAASSLPRLAEQLPATLLLLDPEEGAVGMAGQVRAAAAHFGTDEVVLVDVGGDALTNGEDPGLRSPLADQLALAACVQAALPTRLLIAAPGIDGEIPGETVLARLRSLGAEQLPHLTETDIAPVRHVFGWHPSEASGLLAAAANGHRGLVEVRDAGDQVNLTAETTGLYTVDAKAALEVTPGRLLTGSRSLAQAEAVIRDATGISEIRYETEKALRLRDRRVHRPSAADLPAVDQRASEANARGARYISTRRLAELLHTSTLRTFTELCELLATERPQQYEPSIYQTRAEGLGRCLLQQLVSL